MTPEEKLVEEVSLVIARAEHGSLYPEFGAPDDVPVALHNLRAARAVIPIVAQHCAEVARNRFQSGDLHAAGCTIATALEKIGQGDG